METKQAEPKVGAFYQSALKGGGGDADDQGMDHHADHGVVLIAEEDPATARVMVGWMARAGHDVVCASTAAEALAMADRRRPDVAIVDPGISASAGGGFAERLRAHPVLRRMPLVMVSPDTARGFTAEMVGERVLAAMRAA